MLKIKEKKVVFGIHFGLLLVSELIALLTYFPGVGMNDGLNILMSRMSSVNQFPVFYVMYVTMLGKLELLFGSMQYSIATYSAIQCIGCALMEAYILSWVWERDIPKAIKVCTSFLYIFHPIYAMYAIYMIKDTWFSIAITLLMIELYEMARGRELSKADKWVFLIGIAFGFSLRSNGPYIIVTCLIVALFSFKHHRKIVIQGLLLITILGIMGKAIISYYGYSHRFSETVGIPIQQIAATVVNDGDITNEQRDYIERLMTFDKIKQNYNPDSADPIKWSNDFDRQYLDDTKMYFVKTWIQLFFQNPRIYIKSYGDSTRGYWNPRTFLGAPLSYSIEEFADQERLVQFAKEKGIKDQPIFGIRTLNVLRNYYAKGEIFPTAGTCLWIMIVLFAISVFAKRNYKLLFFYLPCILQWLTVMLSAPVSNSFRYVLCYIYAIPLFICLVFDNNDAAKFVHK